MYEKSLFHLFDHPIFCPNVKCLFHRTTVDNSLPASQQAISGEDFISRHGMVLLPENVTSVPVEIVIKHVSSNLTFSHVHVFVKSTLSAR